MIFLEEVISWKEMNCAGAAAARSIRNAICRLKKKIMMHAERGEIVPTRKILKTPFQIEKIRKKC